MVTKLSSEFFDCNCVELAKVSAKALNQRNTGGNKDSTNKTDRKKAVVVTAFLAPGSGEWS